MRGIYLFLCILIILTTGCLNEKEITEEKLIFPCSVTVIPKTGTPSIVAEKEKLDFGKLPIGMGEKKDIALSNTHDYAVILTSTVNGSISNWISFSPNEIAINSKDSAICSVFIKIPDNARLGNYTGYVTFEIRRK